MSVTISNSKTAWGYHVTMRSNDRQQFASVLNSFKEAIPKRCRLFQPEHGYWYVERRSCRSLSRWLERMREAGAVVFEVEKGGGKACQQIS